MKSKIYYKICSKKPSNRIYCYDYYSAVAFSIGIQYILDKWVEPKIQGTNLMVFDSIENAKKCKKKYHFWKNHVIFECEVKNPSKKGLFLPTVNQIYGLEKIAKLRRNKKKYTHLCKMNRGDSLPEGTIFCKAVKILREVE
jgi:hypothetical protein